MGTVRYRERSYCPPNGTVHVGDNYFVIGNTQYHSSTVYAPYTESFHQGTWDKCIDQTNPGPPYKSGGGVIIDSYHDNTALVQNTGTYQSSYLYKYVGGFISTDALWEMQGVSAISSGNGTIRESAYSSLPSGATGWDKFAPGNSFVDASVFLGELKDFPRMIKQLHSRALDFHKAYKASGGWRNTLGPKKLANDYLAHQFGWIPFVSDVQRAYKGYKKLDDTIQRIRKNNGKWVKRRGTVNSEEGEGTPIAGSETQTGHWPVLNSYFFPNLPETGSYEITFSETKREWFEGKFRYYIPDIDTPEWERRVVRQLFGLTITPSLLWELTPWSWLADWASNAGDVFSNMDTGWAENLTAAYAYVMGTKSWTWNLQSSCDLYDGTITAGWSGDIVRKDRHVASPFGFGLSMDDLSPRQLSILGALGISRIAGRN